MSDQTIILFRVQDEHDLSVDEADRIVEEFGSYMTGGPFPPSAVEMNLDEYMQIGRVPDCSCDLINCVCEQARQHAESCRYRRALTGTVPITCEEHGRDVCPLCDACDCQPKCNKEHETG